MLLSHVSLTMTSGAYRIPAQLLYDWLSQLAAPPITLECLRRVLPTATLAIDEGKQATPVDDCGNGLKNIESPDKNVSDGGMMACT